jgi:NAD(P)-dependent dehydrogenase (short-subunit alcohol dehydrogenase family)
MEGPLTGTGAASFDPSGRVAVITGRDGGIGFGIASSTAATR